MMEPEARRGEGPTYRKPYLACIDRMPLLPADFVQCIAIENNSLLKLKLFGNSLSGQAFTWIHPEITISDLAALKHAEDEPAQEFFTRFRKLKMKCRIPIEERHFIQMAQVALKISLRKLFDGILFTYLAKLADNASKSEDLLKEEQQKRNSSKGTYYKTPSSSVHLVEVESEED
ncbi:unnamed protein product [Prunus armeniaca]